MFYKKRCSEIFRHTRRKAPVLESLFNKVLDVKASSIVKKRLQRSCFPVNIKQMLRTPYLEKHLRMTASARSKDFVGRDES